jgi:hypothetical protein
VIGCARARLCVHTRLAFFRHYLPCDIVSVLCRQPTTRWASPQPVQSKGTSKGKRTAPVSPSGQPAPRRACKIDDNPLALALPGGSSSRQCPEPGCSSRRTDNLQLQARARDAHKGHNWSADELRALNAKICPNPDRDVLRTESRPCFNCGHCEARPAAPARGRKRRLEEHPNSEDPAPRNVLQHADGACLPMLPPQPPLLALPPPPNPGDRPQAVSPGPQQSLASHPAVDTASLPRYPCTASSSRSAADPANVPPAVTLAL